MTETATFWIPARLTKSNTKIIEPWVLSFWPVIYTGRLVLAANRFTGIVEWFARVSRSFAQQGPGTPAGGEVIQDWTEEFHPGHCTAYSIGMW